MKDKSFVILSLLCPLSKSLMKIPVKGLNCDHQAFIDFKSFINFGKIDNKFICPICLKRYSLQEMFVDS